MSVITVGTFLWDRSPLTVRRGAVVDSFLLLIPLSSVRYPRQAQHAIKKGLPGGGAGGSVSDESQPALRWLLLLPTCLSYDIRSITRFPDDDGLARVLPDF